MSFIGGRGQGARCLNCRHEFEGGGSCPFCGIGMVQRTFSNDPVEGNGTAPVQYRIVPNKYGDDFEYVLLDNSPKK